jgi:hypothetical protein
VARPHPAHRPGQRVLESPDQADAVLGHREALIGRRRWEDPIGQEVDLVGEEHEPAAQPLPKVGLPALDRVDERPRLAPGERAERGQALAVARQAHRDDGHRRHLRVERGQLEHRPLQVQAVVEVRAEHDLRVHADAGPGQPGHAGQDVGRVPRPPEQTVTQFGVSGVDRDVEGRQALSLDPREVGLLEVRERDVVAVQERQAKVVVLDVEAAPEAARVLMDEAEDAGVRARGDLAGTRRHQVDAEPGSRALELERPPASVAGHRQPQAPLGGVELEVDGVAQRVAVDAQDHVARAQPGAPRRRAGTDGCHHHAGGAVAVNGAARLHGRRARRRRWR